jgi:hypothetical protein
MTDSERFHSVCIGHPCTVRGCIRPPGQEQLAETADVGVLARMAELGTARAARQAARLRDRVTTPRPRRRQEPPAGWVQPELPYVPASRGMQL